MTVNPIRTLFFCSLVLAFLMVLPAQAAEHRFGLGAQFWRTVDDLADQGLDDLKEDGFAWVLSYQYVPKGLLRFEIDVEYSGEGFGGASGSAITPLGFVLIGRGIYAGVGVGVTYADDFDSSVSDPFYAARLGFQFNLLPGVLLDVHGNYRADAFNELDSASTDAITLGAIVRFSL